MLAAPINPRTAFIALVLSAWYSAMVKDESASELPSWVRHAAKLRGLDRAAALAPETLRLAAERGGRPLASPPEGPLTLPAGGFDPDADSR